MHDAASFNSVSLRERTLLVGIQKSAHLFGLHKSQEQSQVVTSSWPGQRLSIAFTLISWGSIRSFSLAFLFFTLSPVKLDLSYYQSPSPLLPLKLCVGV